MRETSRRVSLLAAIAVLASAGHGFAAEPGAQPADAREAVGGPVEAYQPMRVLGMQVFIDPKTGDLRTPTPEEAATLSAQLQKMFGAAPEPVLVEHRDGMLSAAVDISMMDFSVVRVGPDGTAIFDCVDGARAATALAETPAAAAFEAEEQ